MDNPTKPEAAWQNSGRADVSQGVNSNLSSSDVSETGAAQEIEQAYQHSGDQKESDTARQMDESGMLSPQGQQPGEAAQSGRMGQSGEDRNRDSQ
ncbi:hypothetical protein DKM44_00195 [Deinococcus irradiatisoli]|uniref:Uncharacterized protein n=1 Tax=Deinococcus irradiatisoli TaxID=2202254 RepID=A0A2Z3JIP7_9DEIO|nr:hypothetical protein [Deinococcus irradiatisoli]AWN21848.1 hypothetical protein DKM44_00195 [Deinococcus irradiatisoli]